MVVFNPDTPGDTGFVAVRTEDEEVRNFLLLYLEDPLHQRPVYIEGLGNLKGPHSRNQEQFDRAMSALSHLYPSWGAEPI